MLNKLVWLLLFGLTAFLAVLFLRTPVQQAGDIAEYFGTSQSLLNHGGVSLRKDDQAELEKILHKAYFQDPGYFINGRDEERYPVHFVFYSILLVPVRLLLQFLELNELLALSLTNLALILLAIVYLFKKWVVNPFQRFALLVLLFFSPLAFFISWPGPDLYYVLLVLIALYFFSNNQYLVASVVTAFASWHSQPLLVLSAIFLAIHLWKSAKIRKIRGKLHFSFSAVSVIQTVYPTLVLAIPYFYNLWAFGVFTPWTIFQNGWTRLNGFGLQNISLQKLYEQFFDLNVGLFWYAPLIVVVGMACFFIRTMREKQDWILLVAMLFTALFYQTNPAWHFGTAGYGPTRHILFALPFFIYWIVSTLKSNFISWLLLLAIFLLQLPALFINNWYTPNFQNTLKNSPFAVFAIENYTSLYNPTPEIFVDRTNQTDLDKISTSIYKNIDGKCIKAYVLKTDVEKVEAECGELSASSKHDLENEFLKKASYYREVITTEATFWPHSNSCEDWYVVDENNPYQCIKNIQEFAKMTGVLDLSRVNQVESYLGVWRLHPGLPVKLRVPPGYIIHHYSMDGVYVNF